MIVATDLAHELEAAGYALVEEPEDFRNLLADVYGAWSALFGSDGKFSLHGDRAAPAGYIPMCSGAGCDMKESYYFQTNEKLPYAVDRPTRALAARLMTVGQRIAEQVNAAAGERLIHETTRGCLRVMRYPAFVGDPESPVVRKLATDGGIRACEHTDLNAITLLPSSTAPGLEVRTREGEWVLVDGIPGTTVVQIGQEAAALSRGRFRATVHRVRNPVEGEEHLTRMSAAMFFS